jgi:hypothetical protein
MTQLGSDQPILQPLVVTLSVVVHHVLRDRPTQRRLPDEDHPIQAIVLDGANKSLGIRIQIRGIGGSRITLVPDSRTNRRN